MSSVSVRKKRPARGLACGCCAACCREMVVPINDADLRRLTAASGLPPGRIIALHGPHQVEYDPDSALWVHTRRGRRVLTLKRSGGRCRFLDDHGRCRVYAARPSTCRTFPYEIEYRGATRRPVLTKTDWPTCQARWATVTHRDQLLRDHRREMREDRRFVRRLRQWERTGDGTVAGLLAFLTA